MSNRQIAKSLTFPLQTLVLTLLPYAAPAAEKGGKTKSLPTNPSQAANYLVDTIQAVWHGFVGHLPYIAAGLLVLLATWGAANLVARAIRRFTRRSGMRRSLVDLAERMARLLVWGLGLLLAAMVVFPGLTPTKALGGLGIVSIALGLAFRDIFENFFSGILILWRYPFENGDYIRCQDIQGRVVETTVRNTRIQLITGELEVIPNSMLLKNPVQVLTYQPRKRMEILAGVAYGEDVEKAVEVIARAVRSCESVDRNHPVQVFPRGFGSSSIDIEVAWWTDPKPIEERRSRGEVVTAVKRALDEAGIEIPFPYRTLTFKEPLRVQGREEEPEAGKEPSPDSGD